MSGQPPLRIAMWSGPRNISTAMMRSFAARGDCAVSDEPFYGCFLKQTGEPQPMAEAVIASMDCDWQRVAAAMNGPPPEPQPLWYQKHMPHHMVGPISIADFPQHAHAFLIRDPRRVIASYAQKRVSVTFDDLRYDRQRDYFIAASERLGKAAPVVDSSLLLTDPAGYLRALCASLGIGWTAAMLTWEKGSRASDGIWGSHWYNRVVDTTGFGPPETSLPQLTGEAADLAERCRPYYEEMRRYALAPSPEAPAAIVE